MIDMTKLIPPQSIRGILKTTRTPTSYAHHPSSITIYHRKPNPAAYPRHIHTLHSQSSIIINYLLVSLIPSQIQTIVNRNHNHESYLLIIPLLPKPACAWCTHAAVSEQVPARLIHPCRLSQPPPPPPPPPPPRSKCSPSSCESSYDVDSKSVLDLSHEWKTSSLLSVTLSVFDVYCMLDVI